MAPAVAETQLCYPTKLIIHHNFTSFDGPRPRPQVLIYILASFRPDNRALLPLYPVRAGRCSRRRPEERPNMATEEQEPLKGILKKSKPSPATSTSAPPSSSSAIVSTNPPPTDTGRAPLPRSQEEIERIALHHANLIQQRKDVEAHITDSIVELTELPRARTPSGGVYPASDPQPPDVADFTRLIRLFQPSDYDDLIAERNACGRCGYALCPLPRRTYSGAGTFKLVNVGRDDFDIVRREELERWCSRACARRALYVKVQLSETAAWERAGVPDLTIDLLDEGDQGGRGKRAEGAARDADPVDGQLARHVGRLKLEEHKASRDAAVLALERGDAKRLAGREPVEVNVREKTAIMAPEEPRISGATGGADDHLMLEGHRVNIDAGHIETNQNEPGSTDDQYLMLGAHKVRVDAGQLDMDEDD